MSYLIRYFSTPAPKTVLVFCALLFAGTLFSYIASPILLAVAISMMLYGAMSPLVETLVRKGFSTSKAVSSTMGVVVLLIIIVAAVLLPLLFSQFKHFSERIENIDDRILNLLVTTNEWAQQHLNLSFEPVSLSQDILNGMSSKLDSVSIAISSYFGDIAFSLVLIPLITFFLLCDFRKFRNEFMQLLPNYHFELGWIIYYRTSGQLQRYLRGIFIQAVIIAAICTTGFYAFGVDYAPLLGILVGLLNMIPFFGISLAKIPPVLVVLLSDSPDVTSLITALVVVFVAQFIDATVVIPRVVAKSANLHPLTVMLAVALGGYYFGFFGLILVVPVLFSCKVIFTELYRGLRRRYLTS